MGKSPHRKTLWYCEHVLKCPNTLRKYYVLYTIKFVLVPPQLNLLVYNVFHVGNEKLRFLGQDKIYSPINKDQKTIHVKDNV